jgi:hypothetical protein
MLLEVNSIMIPLDTQQKIICRKLHSIHGLLHPLTRCPVLVEEVLAVL